LTMLWDALFFSLLLLLPSLEVGHHHSQLYSELSRRSFFVVSFGSFLQWLVWNSSVGHQFYCTSWWVSL
jgi:hypothetical protein